MSRRSFLFKAPKAVLRNGIRLKGQLDRATERSSDETATDHATQRTRSAAQTAVHRLDRQGRNSLRTIRSKLKQPPNPQKAAKRTVQTAKTTQQSAKATVKTVAFAARAAISATRTMVAAVMAGGWVAVMLIIVVGLIGLILTSPFGIFLSSDGSGSGQTMQSVVQEVNAAYWDKIDAIKRSVAHDTVVFSGTQTAWTDVLAVYAVKTTSDAVNARDVATVDAEKKGELIALFWQMTELNYRISSRTETVITETEDELGELVEVETTVTTTTLHIYVNGKTADEMATQLHFDEAQMEQLATLLLPEYRQLWATVLYSVGAADEQIVAVALSQVGNVGGEPYWSWYGFSSRVEWCACFVSWCANECSYIDSGLIPKFSACVSGVRWFQEQGQWADNSIEPLPGMIIFFDWDSPNGSAGPQDGQADHVGIVERVEDGIVYTVEGNSGDRCRQRQYPVGDYEILGYGLYIFE